MNYSNGYDLDRVLPVLKARKGWSQPTAATFTPVLDAGTTTCSSSLFYNSEHSACSPVQIWNAQEDAQITDANFNAFLSELKKQTAVESLVAIFRQPCIIEPPKILFEKQFRTSYVPIPNTGKFCGWQFKVAQGDYASKIEKIGLTMSAACTVTVYLYNDLKAAPLWSKEYTVTEGNDQQINVVDDVVLSRLNDTHAGGVFFFGYYQAELDAQQVHAVDVYLNRWEQFNMVGYQGFEAVADYAGKTFVRDNYFSNFRTYGLNVELSTFADHTNTIVRNAYAFDKLQSLIMTQKCIELQMNNQRSNNGERMSRENYEVLYNEIEGLKGFKGDGIPFRQGLKDKIQNEVKQLQKTFFSNQEIITSIPPVNTGGSNSFTWGNRPV